ncbi:hypothetical protein HK096_007668 [Nowakowskiella sp. JEL0078]|nr:hypothetical protein HK096_007668 [Nowakowskiella sp. JEL0078]
MEAPGMEVAYLNPGVAILGAILEKVSGMEIGMYLKKMLDPIMKEQGAMEVHYGFSSNIVNAGLSESMCIQEKSTMELYFIHGKAAGDWIMSPEYLARFMAALVVNSTSIFKNKLTFESSCLLSGDAKRIRNAMGGY